MATASSSGTSRRAEADRGAVAPSVEFDDLDHALIEELRHDGRASNRSLAARLKVNEVTIAARLRRMEDADVLRVVAITDIRLFGHREVAFAMIKVAGRSVRAVAEDIAKLPESIAVTMCTGRFDIIAGVLGRDRLHIADLFGNVLPNLKGVGSVHGSLALDILKYDSKWSLFGVDPGTTPETQPSGRVDQMDLAIISLLQANARRSNRQVAAELGVSEGTVRARIKRMLGDHVFRIQAVSDIVASGVGALSYVLVEAAAGKVDGVARALVRRDDVAQVTRVLDRFDFIAVMLASDRSALINSIQEEMALSPDVTRIEMLDGYATLKHTYAWTWIV